IGTAPLFTNLPDIFQRTFDVIVRQGHLGEGEFGMPPATDIFNAIAIYVAGSKAYHILIMFFALSGIIGIWFKRNIQPGTIFLFVLAISIYSFSYLLAAKLGGPYKYFMPATVGFIVLFVAWTEVTPERFQSPITLALILLAGGLVVKQAVQDFKSHLQRIEQNRMLEVEIGEALRIAGCTRADSIIVFSGQVPFEALALRPTSGTWPTVAPYNEFLKTIEAKFPNVGNIALWSNKELWLPRNVDRWDCMVISDEVRRQISIPLERTTFIARTGEF